MYKIRSSLVPKVPFEYWTLHTRAVTGDIFILQDYENNQEFLKLAHHLLMEVDIINGDLVRRQGQKTENRTTQKIKAIEGRDFLTTRLK